MARASVTSLPAPLAVFVGGCAGGALRLALDHWISPAPGGLPLDIIAINILGAFALGALSAWLLATGDRWWAPVLGPGALGAFTTFSAIAALPWVTEMSVAAGAGLLAAMMAVSVAAAGAGWALGARLGTPPKLRTGGVS